MVLQQPPRGNGPNIFGTDHMSGLDSPELFMALKERCLKEEMKIHVQYNSYLVAFLVPLISNLPTLLIGYFIVMFLPDLIGLILGSIDYN